MKHIKLITKSRGENLGGYDPDDEWSRDSTRTNWTISGVKLAEECYDSVAVSDKFVAGMPVFALYCIYSTGDSFGRDECNYCNLIEVYSTAEAALAAQKTIKEHAEWYKQTGWSLARLPKDFNKNKFKDEYSVEILSEEGKLLTVHADWNGYFESLDECSIYTGILGV